MSTRKLIALALACGLAILLAGGVQLVLWSGQHTSSSSSLLNEGSTAQVGAVAATVIAHRVEGGEVRLDVRLAGASADPAGWALITTTGSLVSRRSIGPGCLGGGSCEVVFDGKGLNLRGLVAVYGQGDQRRSWLLDTGH